MTSREKAMIGTVGSTSTQAWGNQVSGQQNRPPPPDFAKMFSAIDGDSDGMVTETELSQALQGSGSTQDSDDIASLLSSLDTDGDGSVGQSEFTTAMESVLGQLQAQAGMSGMRPPPPPPPDASEMFSSIDADSSGSITSTELSSAFAAQAEATGRSGPNADDFLARFDSDGDGSLTEAELTAGIEAGPPGRGGPPPGEGADEASNSSQFIANVLRHYLESASLGLTSSTSSLDTSV
ncbi:hypothetical protein FHP89_17880 [Denitromonas ohlonensis]|uniref:EF-hand domain-containing protein n=3 Tax=Denitromonas TaxID=139331 RepID=A0A557S640_9RHOO|nr:hypothetical protein FHP90_02865 [Denitromonas ohlonensis]TVO72865.1 hypothetical protein FHP89_17880 [Denitromonas ohlonensis]